MVKLTRCGIIITWSTDLERDEKTGRGWCIMVWHSMLWHPWKSMVWQKKKEWNDKTWLNRHEMTWHSTTRHGMWYQHLTWLSSTLLEMGSMILPEMGSEGNDMIWHGLTWRGLMWRIYMAWQHDITSHVMTSHHRSWHPITWLTWNGIGWNDITRHGTVWINIWYHWNSRNTGFWRNL